MKRSGAFAVLLLCVLVLSGFWTTNKSSGTSHKPAKLGATGAVIGSGEELPAGRTYISVQSTGGAGNTSALTVWSEDIDAAGDSAVFWIFDVWDGNFPHGIDSANVTTLASGDTLLFEVSN